MKPFVSTRCKRSSSIGHDVATQTTFKFGTHFGDTTAGQIECGGIDASEQVKRKLREER